MNDAKAAEPTLFRCHITDEDFYSGEISILDLGPNNPRPIRICVGGLAITRPAAEWHRLARTQESEAAMKRLDPRYDEDWRPTRGFPLSDNSDIS